MARIPYPSDHRTTGELSRQGAEAFRSLPLHDPAKTLEQFRLANRELVRLANSARGLDMRRIRVVSPVTRLWKWSLAAVFAVCAAHDRRHLYQAREAARAVIPQP